MYFLISVSLQENTPYGAAAESSSDAPEGDEGDPAAQVMPEKCVTY